MPTLPPILMVDDDADDIFILKRLLAKAGVENKMLAFEDVRAAIVYLEAGIARGDGGLIPGLAFTDLNMPTMGGLEFAEWVHAQPALSAMRVVMVSSSENPRDSAEALARGVHKFCVKYPTATILRAIVEDSPCRAAPS